MLNPNKLPKLQTFDTSRGSRPLTKLWHMMGTSKQACRTKCSRTLQITSKLCCWITIGLWSWDNGGLGNITNLQCQELHQSHIKAGASISSTGTCMIHRSGASVGTVSTLVESLHSTGQTTLLPLSHQKGAGSQICWDIGALCQRLAGPPNPSLSS